MAIEYFCFFHSYGKKTERLTDEELGRLVRALLKYSETGERVDLPDKEAMAFDFVAADIDLCHAKAESTSAGRRKAIEARWNKQTDTKDTNVSNVSVENKCLYTKTNTKTKTNKLSTNVESKHPTVEEVASYCKERNNSVDAQRFVDYYSSQKWRKANGQPLSDWRAAVRNWEGRDRKDKYHSEGYEQHPITTAQLRDAFVDLSGYD